ncbi:hypothetical protein KR054_005925 [Drosophila jambulina]|nr:hypothetical protein KR054_005925 [Drosophila jambulina]
MPTSPPWPRTRLNWRGALLLSLKCVYLFMVVALSRRSAGMTMNSSLAHKHRRSFPERAAARGALT